MLEQDKKALLGGIQECSNSMTSMEGEREYIKESISILSEKYQVDKKQLKKVVAIYHKQNMTEVSTLANDVQDLYEELTS
jgi:hypothetical protein